MKKNNNIKDSKTEKLFSLNRMKWVYVTSAIIAIGGVMSYGFICYFAFDFNEKNSLTMIAMIPLMLLFYTIAIKIIASGMEKRMRKLIRGIHEVASGNFDFQIELKKSEEYRQIYKEFNDMSRELLKTREEMEAFTNEFAHEFKTPITAIKGFAELLYEAGDELDEEEKKTYLKLIKEESERLCTLSQDTLLLSKVNSMQIIDEKKEFDIYEQIRRCLILLENELNNKQIDIDMDEDIILNYYGNPELMEHVWLNLLSNAIKYSPKNSIIKIRSGIEAQKIMNMSEQDEKLYISISDFGKGMDEETAKHIFEKYYQKDKFSKGNGIGLAIAKRIVELNNGEIHVKSEPGIGTTFMVALSPDM